MTRRRAARFGAIQALYQAELTGRQIEAVILEFERHRLADLLEPLEGRGPRPEVDRLWFASLTRGAWRQAGRARPDDPGDARRGLVAGARRLSAARVPARRGLRAGEQAGGSGERGDQLSTSKLAHAFLSKDEARFINAVLDRLAGQLRPGPEDPAGSPV